MKLKKLSVAAAGGISPNSPVVIDFTQSNFVKITGDNGVGKSSLLASLLVALGYKTKDDKDFINAESGKLDIEFEFTGNDRRQYNVRVTKSKFTLEYDGSALPEPISKMKELLGVPGVSPMEIKNESLDKIVKWLSSYTTKGAEEFEKRMRKIKDGIKSAKQVRADANRSAKGIKESLNGAGLIGDNGEILESEWKKKEAKYKNKVDTKELSLKLEQAGKKSDLYVQAESKVKTLKEQKKNLEDQLAQIEEQLKKGEKYIADNKNAKAEYDAVKEQYDNAAAESVGYSNWQDCKRKKSELEEFETISQSADAKEKELLAELKELQAEIIPDIKGVDLVLEDERENGKIIRKEGMYWNGKNVAQMSESEWWAVCLEIWRKNKTRILVIDNYQSLGTMAVENINKLIKDGAYVFAAEMDRGKKSLEISYQ